jgi:hypothetical protein
MWRIFSNINYYLPISKKMIFNDYCFCLFHKNKEKLFLLSCQNNNLQFTRILTNLKYIDKSKLNFYFGISCISGNLNIAIYLKKKYPYIDPNYDDCFALKYSCCNGYIKAKQSS